MADIAEIHELLESVRVTLASSMNPNREELERLVREQVPGVGATATVPDVPPQMVQPNQGATDDDFDA